MKRIIGILALVLAVGLSAGLGASAAEEYLIPSLFHNDDAWYKDSLAPLRQKDGLYYIPVDMLAMFQGITVQYETVGDNVLVQNGDGIYVSILYSDKTAVVNGTLHSEVGIFREGDTHYAAAEWIAGIFSLTCSYADDEGRTILRLNDAEAVKSMYELLAAYRTEEYEEEIPVQTQPEKDEDGIRRIYLVSGDNYENPTFLPAEDIAANSGLTCTMFLHVRSDEDKFFRYIPDGSGGICADTVTEADAINAWLEEVCFRRVEYVLPATGDADIEGLREAGYMVIEPDFRVDYSTDPDLVYAELLTWLETKDSAVVQVSGDGCSQRMMALLCNLTADPEYCRTEVLLP